MNIYTLPLSDPQAGLAMVGGKGASLARLAQAGLPVPDGFHITTTAYREFVSANGLQPHILEALKEVDSLQPATLEAASAAIYRLFTTASIPASLAAAILPAYSALSAQDPAVAVRSSATAEDLPEASFAGQQETYLNVRGASALLEAVRKCWASLWTARAIAYRLRQGIAPQDVALAVVVQLLILAEAAGILFTANPLTGKRSEAVINAAWGLGEAVVGGLVTPDMITVDKLKGQVLQRKTAAKQVMTVRTASGTQEQPAPEALKDKAVLSDAQAARLVGYGAQIEALYGMPMDIEWAWTAAGGFAILQARPITGLGEAPVEWMPRNPKATYMRTSVADLMPDPLRPLYITLGIPTLLQQMRVMGKRIIGGTPELGDEYYTTINTYAYMCASFPAKGWLWILFRMMPAFPRLLRQLVPIWRKEMRPDYQAFVARMKARTPAEMSDAELWQAAQDTVEAAMYYVTALLFATMGASAGSEMLLTKLYDSMTKRDGAPPASALLMGWNNIPIRAEKSLYDLAMTCREHPGLVEYLLQTHTGQIAVQLKNGQPPAGVEAQDWSELQGHFASHLEQFGHIIFQMDFTENLPLDHPEPMLENIKMYLRGEGVNPHERQQASETRRIQTAQAALGRLKGLRRWAFTKALNWAQSLSEVREDALADIGLGYPILRVLLRQLGSRFVAAGVIQQPEDIFWLEKDEINALVLSGNGSLAERVTERKANWRRFKAATPPPMLPLKERYMGMKVDAFLAQATDENAGGTLKGVATSPGVVTAPARVLHGPEDFDQMRPGEVLVAGTTTPAWTPLFAMASAVVTDIGGPLSHGSIVAREYGIPAVMGTGVATRRIQSGQVITVDGDNGVVTLGGAPG
ncbi:MAG TPA: PEP/pyruvate-binding domain-containing protein [Anaerolineales bacterium]|nr:PEP/pyruvate-binding domain-containing protein [Anaerolineales bacterium]